IGGHFVKERLEMLFPSPFCRREALAALLSVFGEQIGDQRTANGFSVALVTDFHVGSCDVGFCFDFGESALEQLFCDLAVGRMAALSACDAAHVKLDPPD